jgi:hypothetical protein
MRRHGLAAILIATLVVLAGCTGGVGPGAGPSDDTTESTAGTGTVQFYISDQPSAIDDFEHLNVTITKVGFQQADGDGEADESELDEDSNETEDGDDETEMNETASSETDDADDDADESGDWKTYEVENRTVDLTRLQGANATQLTSMNVSNGTYSKVFVYVSEINATLDNGEQVNVKLPSEKLQLNKEFTVGNGEAVDFVFDITVKKAGNSGKYILQPVVSESGTSDQVEIRDVGADDDEEREDRGNEKGEEQRDDDRPDEEALNASFVGKVTQGENATVQVRDDGTAVENASVVVNGDEVGTTDADGELTFVVPDDRELDVEITAGDREAELERMFAGKESGENGDNDNGADYGLQSIVA